MPLDFAKHEDVVVFADPLAVGLGNGRRDALQALARHLLRLSLQLGAGNEARGQRHQRFPIAFEGQLKDHTHHAVVVILDLRVQRLAGSQRDGRGALDDGRLLEAHVFGRGVLEAAHGAARSQHGAQLLQANLFAYIVQQHRAEGAFEHGSLVELIVRGSVAQESAARTRRRASRFWRKVTVLG